MAKSFSPPKNIIFVFIDGIGFGLNDKSANPFSRFESQFFCNLGGGKKNISFKNPGILLETNAQMGIGGAPQSATGQTALFTGFNGPQIMGRHITGFPSFSLRPYLREHSIIKKMNDAGYKSTLLNSYSQMYLDRINKPRGQRLTSASSWIQKSSNLPFFSIEDYRAGKSMYMDITNWFLRSHKVSGFDLIDPKLSGRKLVHLAKSYNLVIYEYFFTDKVGHSQKVGAAKRILKHIDGLLEGIWQELDPENQLLVVSSDHGNMEDLSKSSHTENLVPTFLYGKSQDQFASKIMYLYDIPRAILEAYNICSTYEIL